MTLPATATSFGNLTFRYYLAHAADSGPEDAFRVFVETAGGTQTQVFEETGDATDHDAAWALGSVSIADWAGQTIRLVFAATDGGSNSLVEAAVDDIRIRLP